MKICLVSRRFDKNSGSGEWIYAEWLREQLIKNGFEIIALEQKNAGIKSSRIKKIFYDLFILPLNLIKTKITKKIKVFYFLAENQAVFSWLLRFMGAKTIVESYDLMRIKGAKRSLDKIYFFIVYWLLKFNDELIAVSESTKRDIINFFKIDSNKITVIYPIYRRIKKKNNNRSNKKKILGYLGSLGGIKRTNFFIGLGKEILKRNRRDFEIHIWGRGDFGKLKESTTIKIKGFAKEKDIEKIYNSFDFFIFPCKYAGLGLPPIEAMMCGKPCFILSDIDMPLEVKSKCIICNNPSDMLDKIIKLSNKDKYFKESNKILNNVGGFDSKENLNKLINLLKKYEYY